MTKSPEFAGLASKIRDQVWLHWSVTPAPLILVEADGKFLTHHPSPPKDFFEAIQCWPPHL